MGGKGVKGLNDPVRAERMVNAYVNDNMTLEQIGQHHGCSRERVRQICNKHDPTLYRLARLRRNARSHLRKIVNSESVLSIKECLLCGEVFETTDSRMRFCDTFHKKIYDCHFVYHVDEVVRRSIRRSIRLWKAKNKDGSEIQIENVLNDTVVEHGRWLIVGSLTWHWAIRAYHCNWPIFKELPEQIQNQIIEHEGEKG